MAASSLCSRHSLSSLNFLDHRARLSTLLVRLSIGGRCRVGSVARPSRTKALSFFNTANYSAAGERQECPPDFVPHLDKRALRSGLARC